MSYVKNEWRPGDLISKEKLDHIEEGIANAGSDIEATSFILKGNGNGGAVAAVAGSDYMSPMDPSARGSLSINRRHDSVIGSESVAVGMDTEASGTASFAEGYRTIASGEGSHAECSGSMATGYYSHSEGYKTTASGHTSHAEGSITEARGRMSHAEGFCTLATQDYQHVQGKFNFEDNSGQFADIVGWGLNNTNKKNIEATTVTGDKRMKGDVYVGCNIDSSGGTKLATIFDVADAISAAIASVDALIGSGVI